MQSKPLFPKFWRRQPAGSVPQQSNSKEVPVNKPNTPAVESLAVPGADLPSYEDIYHAAGILSPPSGYSIHKVVEMLNSERLRDLSQDVKRASVLMALDAAGTSVDDLLQDATRRQQALDSYEAGKKKQMEDFESRKAQESAQIEAEMERIRAHYGERIRHNQDLIAQEKEGLHNWQMAMQHESQRIAEVIDLCGKHPMPAASNPASPAISGKMEKPPSTPESTRSAASGRSS
jgi:hypothetical protein